MDTTKGTFLGSVLVQQSGSIGGARFVFVKLQGEKNELVFPTFGGQLMNPFPGKAKFYAGDLLEYRTNSKGYKPSIYLLKTYKVLKDVSSATTVYIERNGYRHIPFAGDFLMAAPDVIGGTGTAVKVTAVTATTTSVDTATVDCWQLTVSANFTCTAGTVLVESEAFEGTSATAAMLVKRINAVAACDYDCFQDNVADPTSLAEDFENARYFFTPALGGLMYKHKMSPIPACVEALNQCNIEGWFKVDGLSVNGSAAVAADASKALSDKVRYSASTTPTTSTVGEIGDIIVVGTGSIYSLTGITGTTSKTYTWSVVGQKNAG